MIPISFLFLIANSNIFLRHKQVLLGHFHCLAWNWLDMAVEHSLEQLNNGSCDELNGSSCDEDGHVIRTGKIISLSVSLSLSLSIEVFL